MTMTRGLVEAGKLLKEGTTPGSRRVRIITEGMGSSGFYSRTLMESSGGTFSGAPSFANHPDSPWAPHRRDVKTIMGKIVEGTTAVEDDTLDDGTPVKALFGDYLPNSQESADWIDANGDLVALSIFCQAEGHEDENGNFVVDRFIQEDPYKSVDIVVAAGRGGKFQRAQESLVQISGLAPVAKPPVHTAEEHQPKEGHMDPKVVEELKELLKTQFLTFAAEFKAAIDADREKATTSEQDIEAKVAKASTDAVESYDEKVKAIDAVEGLLPSQREMLLSEAKGGKDITSALEAATKIVTEFQATLTESDEVIAGQTAGATSTVTSAAEAAKGAF